MDLFIVVVIIVLAVALALGIKVAIFYAAQKGFHALHTKGKK